MPPKIFNDRIQAEEAPPLDVEEVGSGAPPLDAEDKPEYTEEFLKEKSAKHSYSLGDKSPGVENLLANARVGGLDANAREVVRQDRLEDEKTRNQMVRMVSEETKGKPIDKQTYDFIMSLTPKELDDFRTDPRWDANKVYARKVANEQLNSDPFPWGEVFKNKKTEENYHKARDVAETTIAWNETVNDTVKELRARSAGSNFLSQIVEHFETWVLPMASVLNQREVGGPWTQGANKEAQYQKLWAMPLEQRTVAFRELIESIAEDNILDAIEFAEGALSYGRNPRNLDTAFAGVEVVTLAPAATIGKVFSKGSKAVAKGAAAVPGVTNIPGAKGIIGTLNNASAAKALRNGRPAFPGITIARKRVIIPGNPAAAAPGAPAVPNAAPPAPTKTPFGKKISKTYVPQAAGKPQPFGKAKSTKQEDALFQDLFSKGNKISEEDPSSQFLKELQKEFIEGRITKWEDVKAFAKGSKTYAKEVEATLNPPSSPSTTIPRDPKKVIERTANASLILGSKDFDDFLKKARDIHGFSPEDIAEGTGIRTKADYEKAVEEDIKEFVEGPAQDTVRELRKKGFVTVSSNAYGEGPQVVHYLDANGDIKEAPLSKKAGKAAPSSPSTYRFADGVDLFSVDNANRSGRGEELAGRTDPMFTLVSRPPAPNLEIEGQIINNPITSEPFTHPDQLKPALEKLKQERSEARSAIKNLDDSAANKAKKEELTNTYQSIDEEIIKLESALDSEEWRDWGLYTDMAEKAQAKKAAKAGKTTPEPDRSGRTVTVIHERPAKDRSGGLHNATVKDPESGLTAVGQGKTKEEALEIAHSKLDDSIDEVSGEGTATYRFAYGVDELYNPDVAAADLIQATDPGNPNIVSDTLAATGREIEGAQVKAQAISGLFNAAPAPKRQPFGKKVPAMSPKAAARQAAASAPVTPHQKAVAHSLVPTIYSPNANTLPTPHITKLTNSLATRIAAALAKIDDKLEKALMDSKSVATRYSSQEMMQKGFEVAQADFERLYPGTAGSIIEASMKEPEDTLGNVLEVTTLLGKPGQLPFKNPIVAQNWAKTHYDLRPGSFDIKQWGNGYVIEIKTVTDESKLFDFLIPTTGRNSTPKGIANTFLGRFRTQDDLVSPLQNENRKAITHAYSGLQADVKEVADYIARISRNPWKLARFERVLTEGLNKSRWVDVINPRTGLPEKKEIIGQEWDMADFEREYIRLNNGNSPSEDEILAYEVYKRLLGFDLAVRNLDLYRDKAVLGVNEWRFQALVDDIDNPGQKKLGWSQTFDGKVHDELPYDSITPTKVGLYDESTGFTQVLDVKGMSESDKALIDAAKQGGARIIEVANPSTDPLNELLGINETINFVMVKRAQASPLKLAQLPKSEGGHRILADDHYVKLPKMKQETRKVKDASGNITEVPLGTKNYSGDITIGGFHSAAKAQEFKGLLEKARELFNNKDRTGFLQFVQKHLPRDPQRLWDDFIEWGGENEFHVTISGEGVNDTESFRKLVKDDPKFVDSVDSQFNLYRQINKKFAGEKSPDVLSGEKAGSSQNNPVFTFKTSRYIDPLQSMQTGMSSLMRNRAMSDYVNHAVRSWIEENGHLLKVEGGMAMLRSNPLHYLHNPSWVDNPANRDAFEAAKNSRLAVINLLGTRSDLKDNVDWLKNKAVDAIYGNKLGAKFGINTDKVSEKVADMEIFKMTDPISFMRRWAFNVTMGFFNPVQIWTQSQVLVHMTAITGNPVRAGRSLIGSAYMQALQMTDNPNVIDGVASMAAASGFGSKDEFLESLAALKRTKLWNVEGEHGWVNDIFDHKMFQGVGSTMLDKGLVFFRGTERYTRLGSWNIAFLEWKKANPGKTLTRRSDINEVLARQNLLAGNMTNDSAANIQKGIFSVPTMFMGYQMRLLDQVLGKRLTVKEKMRVLTAYSLMYGVPIGGTVGMINSTPWMDDIHQAAEDYGIDTHSGGGQLFFQGGLSFLTEWAMGDEYNPGKRYGPGGFEFLKNALDADSGTDALLTLMGASTGIMGNTVEWMAPALATIWSQVSDKEGEVLPMDTMTFIDAFRSISTVNNGVKAGIALYYGEYQTRGGMKITSADEVDALAIALFGLTPSSVGTMYDKLAYVRNDKEAMKVFESEFIKNLKRAIRVPAGADRDMYIERANIMANSAKMTEREQAKAVQKAWSGDENLLDAVNNDYRELRDEKGR